MIILLESFGIPLFFIILGLVFFAVCGWAIMGSNAREDRYQELSNWHHTAAQNRSDAKQRILWQIGSPECSDGTYSPRQKALWDEFNRLDAKDQRLTALEHHIMVEVRGYLPDEIADIIEGE